MIKYLFEYRRVSSKRQLHGEGMAIQQIDDTLRTKLCDEHSLVPFSKEFDDAGISAYSKAISSRPAFNELLSVINQPDVSPESIVVLYNWDRLSRQDVHTAMTTLMQVTAQVRLYIVSENRLFDKSDPDLMVSLMMALVGLARAGDESAMKSKRTRGNALELIQEHQAGTRNEYGEPRAIKSVGSLPWWIDASSGYIKVNEPVAEVVREIVRKSISGWGMNRIMEWLNSEITVRPPNTIHWDYGIISRLHNRKTLFGEYSLTLAGTKYELVDYIPAIIDEPTYWQFVEAKKSRSHSRSSTQVNSFLTGIGKFKCRHCGSAISGTMKGGKLRYYCITGSRQKHICSGVNATAEPIEQAVMNNLSFLSMVPDTSSAGRADAMKIALTDVEERLNQVTEDYITNPSNVLAKVMASLELEVEDKRKEYEAAVQTSNNDWIVTEIPEDIDEKRALLRRSMNSIQIFKHKKFCYLITLDAHRVLHPTHIYIKQGVVVKTGSFFKDYAQEEKLMDRDNFLLYTASGKLDAWLDIPDEFDWYLEE